MADESDPSRRMVVGGALAVGATASGLLPVPANAIAVEPPQTSDFDPRVQRLIDRIGAVSLGSPRLDAGKVAASLEQALDVAGLPRRPLRWFADSMSAHCHVWAVATAAARQAVGNAPNPDFDIPAWNAAMMATWDDAWHRFHRTTAKAADAAAMKVLRRDVDARERRRSAWLEGHAAAEVAAHHALLDRAFQAAAWPARALAHRASTAAFKAPPNGVEGETAKAAAWATWRAVALRSPAWLAHNGAAGAVAYLNALLVFDHPAQAEAAAFARPMVDAMEGGLLFYWVTPREVICVPRPALHQGGRDEGTTVAWPSGESYVLRHDDEDEPSST